MITLVTGGIKSGKSAYALKLMNQKPGSEPKKGAFIATADPDDNSMKIKIAAHQKERAESPLITIEEKINIGDKIQNLDSSCEIIIIDCLTLWMSNLIYFVDNKENRDEKISLLIRALQNLVVPCIIITNEVGLGIIPENKLARQYQDELGALNAKMAQIARNVVFMISGIPLKVK